MTAAVTVGLGPLRLRFLSAHAGVDVLACLQACGCWCVCLSSPRESGIPERCLGLGRWQALLEVDWQIEPD